MTDRCHNCGGTDLQLLYRAPPFDAPLAAGAVNYGVARCRACSLVNTTGIAPREVGPAYSAAYYGSVQRKFIGIVEYVLSALSGLQAHALIRRWRAGGNASQPAVLDIGCGRGLLLRAFRSSGARVMGLERPEFPVDGAVTDAVSAGSLDDTRFADTYFDIIVLRHVLEHMDGQEALLDTITEHLNPRGLLLLAVPNFDSLQQRIFGRHWFHLDLPRHLVHLESRWLAQQLRERGYFVESQSHVDLVQNVYGFLQSSMNALAPTRPNAFYRLLKHGESEGEGRLLPALGWTALGVLLMPAALLESLAAGLLRRGATVQLIARRGSAA